MNVSHGPWRGIAAVIHHKRHGEHEVTVEVRDADDVEPSIREWLAMPRVPSAPERVPVMPHVTPKPSFPPSFDDDEIFWTCVNRMVGQVQARAVAMAAVNDRRMEKLLSWSSTAVARSHARWLEFAGRWVSAQFVRRDRRNVRAAEELAVRLAQGELGPEQAAHVMAARAVHASDAAADSGLLTKLTPEVLAEHDAQKARVAS